MSCLQPAAFEFEVMEEVVWCLSYKRKATLTDVRALLCNEFLSFRVVASADEARFSARIGNKHLFSQSKSKAPNTFGKLVQRDAAVG